MQFVWVREGGPCRERCRAWIAASGRIAETSPTDFEAFVRGLDVRGATIMLDSGGGLVEAGLALGRAFRRLGLTTSVGHTTLLPADADGERRAVLSPRATCASMCSFALLGGVRRHIPEEARVLVHQIWPGKLRQDAVAATYSAGHMVGIQRELGLIARYTVEMGVDIELFEIAMRIPPWEAMRPLTRAELARLRVDNTAETATGVSAPASVPATSPSPARDQIRARQLPAAQASAAPSAVPQSPVQRVALAGSAVEPPRAWSVGQRAGRPVLSRRHPLTVEGQEIGNFEISFACGGTPEVYQVSYDETRLVEQNGADRVKSVRMIIAREKLPLQVASSLPAGSSGLASSAHGIVAASLFRALETRDGVSLMLETITVGNRRTAIRVGPSGLADGIREIAAGCPK